MGLFNENHKAFWGVAFRKYMIYIMFIVMFIAASLVSPYFLTLSNIINVIRQVSIYAIIAYGMTCLIISGVTDLSPGSTAAFTGCAGVMLYVALNPLMPVGIAIALAILYSIFLGFVIGILNAVIVTKYKVPSFMATLATMTSVRGLALLYTNGKVIYNIGAISVLGTGDVFGIPIPVIIMFVLFIIAAIVLKKTRYGRYLYACGGNEEAAIASGINVRKIRSIAFMVNGALSGLAGIILMCRLNTGQPTAAEGYEFDAIIGAVLGGTSFSGGEGSMLGTLIGILIVGIINNILNLLNVQSYYHQIIKGALIVFAVIMDMRGKKRESII